MVDSLHFDLRLLYGLNAVENSFCCRRAVAFCSSCSETTQALHCVVSRLRHQPSVWLQVAVPVSSGWSLRLAQPFAPPASFAPTHLGALATSGAPPSPTLPALGRKENLRPLASPIPSRPPARRAHHHQVVATALSDAPPPSSFPARAASDLAAVDPARRTQRGLDGGFQRFLSHHRRHPLRSAHRPRSLQPLAPGGAHPAAPAPSRGATGVYRPVPSLRSAQGHPHGQWLAFRQHGRLGSLGLECVVVDFGHPRRVYSTRPSRGERRA